MHASVQHKPRTSHSMFIKVATADYVLQHSEGPKNIFSVSGNGASGSEAVCCYMHWSFLDSHKGQRSPP